MNTLEQVQELSFVWHPIPPDTQTKVRDFIKRNWFPVTSIQIDKGEAFKIDWTPNLESTPSAQIFVSEPVTWQEEYRLTEQLDHDVGIWVFAEDMKIILDSQDLQEYSFDQHRQMLQRRLIWALNYDICMQSVLGWYGKVLKIQLAPIGFFRKVVNKSWALDLLLPTGDSDVQERVLDFSRAMDTYGRIVHVGLRKTHQHSIFDEIRWWFWSH